MRQRAAATEYRKASSVRYYADGNTVRVQEPVLTPERRRKAVERVQADKRRREQELAEAKAKQKAAARQRALSIDLPYLLLLTAAVFATVLIVYQYLSLKASIDQHMNSVKTLELRLEDMKMENDALEQSINTSVDLNHVYNVAVNELGMVHAGKDSIIQYDKTESEYVRQYEDIPKK